MLDMYKGVSKDQRDKVQLMATEKKLRSEIDEMRNQMKKIQVNSKPLVLLLNVHFICIDVPNRRVSVKSVKNWPTKMRSAK